MIKIFQVVWTFVCFYPKLRAADKEHTDLPSYRSITLIGWTCKILKCTINTRVY